MRVEKLLAVLAAMVLVLASCGDGAGTGTGDPAFAGTVTVSNSSVWEDLRIGYFSAGVAGTYPDLDTTGSPPVLRYRDADDNSEVELVPVVTPLTFTPLSSTSRNYVLYLPGRVPPEDEKYFVVAWIDSVGDGKLRLLDGGDESVGDPRFFATHDTTDFDDDPVTVTVTHVIRVDPDFRGSDSAFKYQGTSSSYTEIEQLKNGTNPGFNFDITVP